jgi:hypothetical protein
MKNWSRHAPTLGLLASSAMASACSDDPRLPTGEHFSERATGIPGVVLIDDMEDGTQYIITDNGLQGLWYTYNDESPGASQEPSQGFPMYRTDLGSAIVARDCQAPGSPPFFAGETDCSFVARTWGDGQRGWGAGIGLDLNGEGGVKNAFDASNYGGIGFFVMGNVRGGSIRVNVQDVRTTPESAGAADRELIARCESFYDDGGAIIPTGTCNDHYGRRIAIGPEWTWVEIPFGCMAAEGWGFNGVPPVAFLPEAIVGIQFQISGPDPADSGTLPENATIVPFDFAIDNLAFLEKSLVADPPVCPVAPPPVSPP